RKVALDLCTGDRYELALAGLRVRPEWFQHLATKVPDRDLPGLHLARVVMHVPGYRRTDLARRALQQQDLKKPTDKSLWTGELEGFLAFLEVTAPDSLRALLHTWAASDNQELCNYARTLQLKIGDETAANDLITAIGQQRLDERAPVWLAQIKSPKVESFLRRLAKANDPESTCGRVHALAVHYGLPVSVGWERKLRKVDDEVFEKVRQLVLDQKPVDALVHLLHSIDEADSFYLANLGLVRDPRVTKYLEQVQGRRHLGLYAWATSQLGIQGQAKAREEFWQGCLIGRYRWIDNNNVRALTLNHDLLTIPFWLRELETNCCRRNSANQVFEDLFGLDLLEHNKALPEVQQAREFWERNRDSLRWSRIKGHYVAGPDG
ncbi:MAG: hypothetical protein ACYST0_13215, partial [Planctomycetota bacterium]